MAIVAPNHALEKAQIKSSTAELVDAKKDWQRNVSEAVFLKQVIDLARWRGWLVNHQRPAMTKQGWRTAISGDAGFPDLVMLRSGRAIFAELKSAKGRVTPEQETWLCAAKRAGLESYVWFPKDIDEIERILK